MLTKDQKKLILESLTGKLDSSKAVVFSNYQGLTVNDLQDLRQKLRKKDVAYKIVKNTLLKLALKTSNLEIEESILAKPLAIAISQNDEVEPAKILFEFNKANKKLEILGGLVNKKYMDVSGIKLLANLPSREALYAKIVGSIRAPLSGLVNVLGGNLRGLVSVLNQYKEQKAHK